MAETWIINSEHTKKAFIANVEALFAEHKYITYSAPRIGADRSLGQNALFHVWLTEFGCHLAKCHFSQFTDSMLEGTKRSMKMHFQLHHGCPWMVHEIICPINHTAKKDYTSSARWKQGEMFMFLEWFQNFAAGYGCILESKGEFAKLQRETQA